MKNLIKFLAVLLLFVGYTSCDELDKLTEVDLSTTVTEIIPVTVDDGAGLSVDLGNSIVINLGDYIDAEYLNKISDVKINSLTYKVINFFGDPAGVITADFMANSATLYTHTGEVVKDHADMTTVFSINDTAALSVIANNLRNGANVEFAVDGTSTNEGGMNFEIEITLSLNITADAL